MKPRRPRTRIWISWNCAKSWTLGVGVFEAAGGLSEGVSGIQQNTKAGAH